MIAINSTEQEEAIKLLRFLKLYIHHDLSPMRKFIDLDLDQESNPEIS